MPTMSGMIRYMYLKYIETKLGAIYSIFILSRCICMYQTYIDSFACLSPTLICLSYYVCVFQNACGIKHTCIQCYSHVFWNLLIISLASLLPCLSLSFLIPLSLCMYILVSNWQLYLGIYDLIRMKLLISKTINN